jgi:hypothetical protein
VLGNYPLTVGIQISYPEAVGILISESRRKGVAFVSVTRYDSHNDAYFEPIGTAFFVNVTTEPGWSLYYAVTAQHCIPTEPETVTLEVTDEAGISHSIPTKTAEWKRHPQTDIACRRIIEAEHRDIKRYNAEDFINDIEVKGMGGSSGWEVFMLGLFSKAPYGSGGVAEPVARFGRVSLPRTQALVYLNHDGSGRPIKEKTVNALLVESLSFAGESGSPVFMHFDTVPNHGADGEPFHDNMIGADFIRTPLIGMISAHWTIPADVTSGRKKHVGDVHLNSGMAVVIPAREILEFVTETAMEDNKHLPKKSRNHPTTPLSRKIGTEATPAFTKEAFESALKKVSKRIQPSQSDEGK